MYKLEINGADMRIGADQDIYYFKNELSVDDIVNHLDKNCSFFKSHLIDFSCFYDCDVSEKRSDFKWKVTPFIDVQFSKIEFCD